MTATARPARPAVTQMERFLRRSGARSLRTSREGKWLIGITLGAGFAALNTGNNLLFFGWGLLLASVVLSGVLSELTVRVVRVRLLRPDEQRVGEARPLPLLLENTAAKLPAFGVECVALIDDGAATEHEARARYQLRLSPRARVEVRAMYRPTRRGVHRVTAIRAATQYPFGFFEKRRHFVEEPAPEILVVPRRVDTGQLPRHLLSRLGTVPTRRAGPGDEFFSLRQWREGDDPRQVSWRRSARVGRMVVRETEARQSRKVIVAVAVDGATPELVEETLAWAGSLAEDLLRAGHAVGLSAPGIALGPAAGGRQRGAILAALARLDAEAPVQPAPAARGAALVAVVAEGTAAPADAAFVQTVTASASTPSREAA